MKSLLSTIIIITLTVSGCASIEEGETDYVRTIANKATDTKTTADCDSTQYSRSTFTKAGQTRNCYETLYRKYTQVPEIKKGDTISVHLMQAFHHHATEWFSKPSELYPGTGPNAEIAIIANVCEQGISGCAPKYGPDSTKTGRVIYYSNGVKAKQYLNFSYLPVYGPIKYQGGPLFIQISVLELDNLSAQQKNLLKALADAGKTVYPPVSQALSILDKAGASLLAGNNDDVMFRYTMSLVPESSEQNYHSPIIAEGNYALIRKDTIKGPQEKEVVDELKFDHQTGRLVKECDESDTKDTKVKLKNGKEESKDYIACTEDTNTGKYYKDYRGNTYLTLQIKSGFEEKTLDNLQTFESLLQEINAESDQGALEVIDAFSDLKQEVSRNNEQTKLLKQIENIKKSLSKIPEDNFGLYSNQVFQLYDEYTRQVSEYTKSSGTITSCVNASSLPERCNVLITPEQLTVVQLKMRSLLNLINPRSDASTIIPTGYVAIDTKANFESAFNNGYRESYNKFVFKRFLGELDSVKKLANRIELLKSEKAKKPDNEHELTKEIQKGQTLLRAQLKLLLDAISNDISLKLALACFDINSKTCYRYLSTDRMKQVVTIFNQFANTYGLESGKNLNESTAKKASENITIIDSLSVFK